MERIQLEQEESPKPAIKGGPLRIKKVNHPTKTGGWKRKKNL